MYLVDTSVWVDFLRGNSTPAVDRVKKLLQSGADIGISATILQEILQGAMNEHQFIKLREYFENQQIYLPKDPIHTAIAAARLYFDCRRRGITVRSSNDCLIALIAVEYDLILLHSDADFRRIGEVLKELKEISN